MVMRYLIPSGWMGCERHCIKKKAWKKCSVYGDDGEKFGLSPWTHDGIYTKGVARKFFNEIKETLTDYKQELPSDYIAYIPALGRI
jgi:hypothetical protein